MAFANTNAQTHEIKLSRQCKLHITLNNHSTIFFALKYHLSIVGLVFNNIKNEMKDLNPITKFSVDVNQTSMITKYLYFNTGPF